MPSPSSERLVSLPAGVDLHARPAAQFVRTAMGFSARIAVAAGEREVDAKSLLSVLSLGAKGGTPLRLRADGDDAPVAARHARRLRRRLRSAACSSRASPRPRRGSSRARAPTRAAPTLSSPTPRPTSSGIM